MDDDPRGIDWLPDLESARRKAAEERKLLLVDFYKAPGCGGCAKMKALTYPEQAVQEALARDFVCVRINTYEMDAATSKLVHEFRKQWSPLFVWLDHHGIEVRRQNGYLPVDDFLAECHFARGYAALLQARYADALAVMREAADHWPETDTAPEALFWAGVAANRNHDGAGNDRQWADLKARYPKSSWWSRASFRSEDWA